MVLHLPSHRFCHFLLALLYFGIEKFLDLAAMGANEMVVMRAFVQLVYGLATFEMTAAQDGRLLELGQDTVNGGQADVGPFFQQDTENVFRSHVALAAGLEDLQDLQSGQRSLEAGILEVVDIVVHGGFLAVRPAPAERSPQTLPLQSSDHIACAITMFDHFRRCLVPALTAAFAVLLAGCGTVDSASNRLASAITPYKIEIVQGNFVSKEQVAALQTGMSRIQVKEVLGTPLITNLFRADRWDYVFTIKRPGVEPQSRRLSLYFENDLLARFEGDEMPTEADFVAALDTRTKLGAIPALEATPAQLNKFPARSEPLPDNSGKAIAAEAAPPRTYPPLEPGTR